MLHTIFLILALGTLQAQVSLPIDGCWRFYKSIYRGHDLPERDPDMVLVYEFLPDKTSRLWWHNVRTNLHCEREGVFQYNGNILRDESTWINPKNSHGCWDDPDMRPGAAGETRAEIRNGEFHMWVGFGSEDLIYVARQCKTWEREVRVVR